MTIKREIGSIQKENLRGGQGMVTITPILNESELKPHASMFAHIILSPFASIGYHEHHNECETYYILAGVGQVDDNGTIQDVKAGDVVLTKDGAGHAISNTSNEPLELIAMILNS